MEINEFIKVLKKSASNIVDIGIKKGYFEEGKRNELLNKLVIVIKNGIDINIEGNAVYGVYKSKEKKLCYNAKVFKNEEEAMIYVLHEMKHALDDFGNSIGFNLHNENNGVGINEGATQRFATDLTEEILGKQISKKEQTSLGIMLYTNLDEYQIEDKMNQLLCIALGISQAEFLRMQNQSDGLAKLKEMFDKYADFNTFQNALDEIYALQEQTWSDENGNILEEELNPTKEQTYRAKSLIRICQEQIIQYAEKANPESLDEINKNMVMIDGNIMSDWEMLYQDDYLKYQDFITNGLNLGDASLVIISGLGGYPFEQIYDGTYLKELLANSDKPFTEKIYIRKNDTYQMIDVTFDLNGVIAYSKPQPIDNLEKILDIFEHSEVIGNAEEYIKILLQRGETEKATIIRRKYEYFMNNRDKIPDIQSDLEASKQKQHQTIDLEDWLNSSDFLSEIEMEALFKSLGQEASENGEGNQIHDEQDDQDSR